MAIPIQQPDEQKQMQQGPAKLAPSGAGQPAMDGRVSAGPAQQPVKAVAPVAAAPAQRKTGTGFTNIGRILQANVGSRAGQAVASGIQQAGQKAGQAIGQAQQQFGQALQKADIGSAQSQQELKDVLARVGQGGQPTEAEVAKFGQYLKGQYAGPMSLAQAGDQNIQAQAQQAQQLGGLLGSSGGKTALLQRFAGAGGRRYTAGQQALDLALLGQQQSSEALKQARQQVLGVGRQFETAEKTAQAQAQEAQARAAGVKELAQKGIAEQLSPLEQTLAQRAEEQTGARKQQLTGLVEKLKKGEVSSEELDKLGLSELKGQKALYGVRPEELAGYFDPIQQATKAGVASLSEAGKMQALGKLAGRLPEEFKDISTTGKYGAEGITGKQKDLVSRVKEGKEKYETAARTAEGQYRADLEAKLSPLQQQKSEYEKGLQQAISEGNAQLRNIYTQLIKQTNEKISTARAPIDMGRRASLEKLRSDYGVFNKGLGE